jgi:hypothetical protein
VSGLGQRELYLEIADLNSWTALGEPFAVISLAIFL